VPDRRITRHWLKAKTHFQNWDLLKIESRRCIRNVNICSYFFPTLTLFPSLFTICLLLYRSVTLIGGIYRNYNLPNTVTWYQSRIRLLHPKRLEFHQIYRPASLICSSCAPLCSVLPSTLLCTSHRHEESLPFGINHSLFLSKHYFL